MKWSLTLLRKIFQNRNLTLLWLGQMISQSGDSIYQIGLLWLVLELSGSESVTGLVAMASYLPSLFLALFAGVAADRGNRRTIMLSADGARALFVLAIPILALIGNLNPLFLGINAFAIAIAATFFNPARDSLVPQIVPKDGLVRANSLIQTSWQASMLIGPFCAGLLLHYAGNVHLFTWDALAYGLSFMCILFIIPKPVKGTFSSTLLPPCEAGGENRAGRKSSVTDKNVRRTEGAELSAVDKSVHRPRKRDIGLADIREGLNYVFHQPVILPLLLITIADNLFIMGPAIVGTPVFIKEDLGLGADAYALIQGCYAVGMLLGTAWLLTFGSKFGKGKVLLVGMVLDGITFIPIYWLPNLNSLAVLIVIHSLAIPLLTVSRASLIQSIVPDKITGRVFALVNLSVVGMSALSSGIAGFLLEEWGARMLFLVIGIGGGLCGVIGWIWAGELKEVKS